MRENIMMIVVKLQVHHLQIKDARHSKWDLVGYSGYRLRHTLLPRTFYRFGTLCIVIFCSKEQFALNWLVTVSFLTHFTPQHTDRIFIEMFQNHDFKE
jgi:hypothetical protein